MVPGARLVILGKQGAGKGTQCIRLSRHYVVPHISTGDMFRGAVRSRSEAGIQAQAYMDAGELIPDSVVIGLVAERLANGDTNRGFVLDGFPRTVAQAEALAELLAPRGLDLVIDLEVQTEVVLKRLASRRVCEDCGANYSAKQPPKVDWVCDVCGGEVVQRQDDTEAAIRRRLELYERETAPLIAWYAAQGMLVAVDGMGPPGDVAARVVHAVDGSRQRGLLEAARASAPGALAGTGSVPASASSSASSSSPDSPAASRTATGSGSAPGSDPGPGAGHGAGSPGGASTGAGSGSAPGSGQGSAPASASVPASLSAAASGSGSLPASGPPQRPSSSEPRSGSESGPASRSRSTSPLRAEPLRAEPLRAEPLRAEPASESASESEEARPAWS